MSVTIITMLSLIVALGIVGIARESHRPTANTAAILAVLGLAGTAIVAGIATPVTGLARDVALTLVVAAAALSAAPVIPALLDVIAAERLRHPDRSDGVDGNGENPSRPLRGGRIIGILERTAVVAALLTGWPEGIAVVLAVKGLARYPEIREAKAGEQFIIGTFGSVLWAVGFAGVGHLITS